MSARAVLTVGGTPQVRGLLEHGPDSDLCKALAERYPGITFGAVSVVIRHDGWMCAHPEAETTDVYFSLRGSLQALVAHGFDRPASGPGHALRKGEEIHLVNARYPDGLDRIALLRVPELLERLQRRRSAGDEQRELASRETFEPRPCRRPRGARARRAPGHVVLLTDARVRVQALVDGLASVGLTLRRDHGRNALIVSPISTEPPSRS